ncbi:MAG: CPBP family intramembrane metalloprotease [Flavobacteriaceae bacterium]|nr:CPBP family intramembrane metalloprotease [Flavobacteriaceae bacterium]
MGTNINIFILISFSFVIYFIISYVSKILKVQNVATAISTKNGLRLINVKHIVGIILFGIIFYLLVPPYRSLLAIQEFPGLILLLLFLTTVFTSAILAFNSAKDKDIFQAETIRHSFNNKSFYFIIRIIFLFSYEFFFRGILFFSLLELNGLFIAITITTILYVLIHVFDTKKEIIGAIPFGIILCLFSYYTQSIWMAFIIHMTLSVVYELSILKQLSHKIKLR